MRIEYDEGEEEEERHKWYQWKLKPPPLGIKILFLQPKQAAALSLAVSLPASRPGCRSFTTRP